LTGKKSKTGLLLPDASALQRVVDPKISQRPVIWRLHRMSVGLIMTSTSGAIRLQGWGWHADRWESGHLAALHVCV